MRYCRASWSGLAVLSILLAAGCAHQTAPPQAAVAVTPTISADAFSSLKAAYLAANPDARLGRVAAVLPNIKRVAVSDVTTADFKKGDILSLVDQNFNVLANGTVFEIDSDWVYVQYEPATIGSRPPVAGDMAVRAEKPDRSQ